MWKEFKEFAIKGNVVDLAVGVIIGGAFNKIVSSLVNDIIMPTIGIIIGGYDFTGLKIIIKNSYGKTPELSIKYGSFIQAIVDFLILAFTIFLIIKALNKFRKKDVVNKENPAPTNEEKLLTEIRDILKNK